MCSSFQLSYHKYNESQREQTVLSRLKQGEIIALISDAGTPGISDPGAELVSLPCEYFQSEYAAVAAAGSPQ